MLRFLFAMLPLLFMAGCGASRGILRTGAIKGDERAVRRYIAAGGDPNVRFDAHKPDRSYTALHLACREGHLGVVKQLVAGGADVNAGDANGRTAIMYAVDSDEQAGALECVRYLLEHGADASQKDFDGDSALHSAAGLGRVDLLELLIRAGADVNAAAGGGRITPLHNVSFGQHDGQAEAARRLLTAGAWLDARSHDGKTPLDFARERERPDLVELFETAMKGERGATTREAVGPASGK